MTITWLVSTPADDASCQHHQQGRVRTRVFRTRQLYDLPAIRGGGRQEARALVVVAVVLFQELRGDHVGRENARRVNESGPRAKPLPAAREHREAAPRVAGAFGARGEGHFCSLARGGVRAAACVRRRNVRRRARSGRAEERASSARGAARQDARARPFGAAKRC